MVIEEPKVVNEPKELEVPEFNKKEIVGIVNQGISNGQIGIPATGTKLYQHKVTIQESTQGSTWTTTLLFITKSDSSLVGVGADEVEFLTGWVLRWDEGYHYGLIVIRRHDWLEPIYYMNPLSPGVESLYFEGHEEPCFLTDVVTEL